MQGSRPGIASDAVVNLVLESMKQENEWKKEMEGMEAVAEAKRQTPLHRLDKACKRVPLCLIIAKLKHRYLACQSSKNLAIHYCAFKHPDGSLFVHYVSV